MFYFQIAGETCNKAKSSKALFHKEKCLLHLKKKNMFLRNQASIAYLFRWCHIYCINMNNPGSLSHLRVRKVPWIRGGSQTHNLRFKNPEDLLRQNNLTSKNTCCIIGTIAPILILPHFISVVKQISTLLLLPLKGEADEGENYYMLGPRVGDPYSKKHKEARVNVCERTSSWG